VGEGGRCGAGGRPVTVDQNGGELELGVGRVEARRGEAESGMRCGEGKGRRRSAPLMAFKSSVLGGEMRGE
jgi:hypothetical protein